MEQPGKGNRKMIFRYKNDYGLYFLFAQRVIEQIAEDSELSVKFVRQFGEIYYIQRYIVGSSTVNISELVRLSDQLGFGYSTSVVTRMFQQLHELGLVEHRGARYHLTRASADFLKRFGYWLHFHISNLHSITNGVTVMTQRRRNAKKKAAIAKKVRKLKRKT